MAEFITAIILALGTVYNLLFESAEIVNGNISPKPGPLIPLFGLVFVTNLLAITIRLFNRFRNSFGREREQFRYLTFGIVMMLLIIGIFNVFFVLILKNPHYVVLGMTSFIVLEGSVFYAITRHRLLDIRLVVARTVAYTLLLSIIGVFYTTGAVLASSVFLKTPTPSNQILLYTGLTIVVAFTFQPLRRWIETHTDKIFFKGRYDSQELLLNLTKVMATTLGLDQLQGGVLERLLPEMRISKGAFVILIKGKVSDQKLVNFDKPTKFVGVDIETLLEPQKLLILDELPEGREKNLMRDLDINVAVPLKVGENDLGMILLGNKQSGEIYSEQDIKLLEILAPEVSIAVQNAKAYEEIKRFNITLQEEIRKATKQLRDANEQLKELDELKDEFMSIASHELRTPMTAIKSYVWLALNGRAGDISEKLQGYLSKVYGSSERMIALINDMLNVSRIETGRLQMEIAPASIYKVVEQVIGDLTARAQQSGIKLILKKDNVVPLIMADAERLAEVFTNLTGNALKFTLKGGSVTISAEKKDNLVEVSVKDTGVGIAKEDLPKLFQKYGKLGDSYATMAQSASSGTGLGLYITKQYLEKMHGSIRVESQLGKGSTFTFALPIATEKQIASHHASKEETDDGIFVNPKFEKQETTTVAPKNPIK